MWLGLANEGLSRSQAVSTPLMKQAGAILRAGSWLLLGKEVSGSQGWQLVTELSGVQWKRKGTWVRTQKNTGIYEYFFCVVFVS